jgi:hypothetical protein
VTRRKLFPLFNWRILAHNRHERGYGTHALDLRFEPGQRVEFDEVVIGYGEHPEAGFIHLEVMDDDHLWMDVCGVKLDVLFKRREVHLNDETDEHDCGWKLRQS